MSFDAAFGLAFVVCIGLLIFGLVKGFPWFIIQGSLVNGAMVVFCFYLLFKILANISYFGVGGAIVLTIPVIAFGAICIFNIRNFLSGQEAENFYELVRERVRARLKDSDEE